MNSHFNATHWGHYNKVIKNVYELTQDGLKKKKVMGIVYTDADSLPSSLIYASFLWNLIALIQALAPPLVS